METIEDLRELMQDDIVCAMAGWSYGGGSTHEDVNDCTSDLCNIVINRIEEFVNKKILKTLDKH